MQIEQLNPLPHNQTSRRAWLKTFGLIGVGLCSSRPVYAAENDNGNSSASADKRALRLAQISDIHLQPELGAVDGFTKCLHHIQSQKDAPKLILNTGDCIMDSMARKMPRTQLQWDLWKKILKEECSLPVENAIGNHDCWGLDRTKSGTTGEEALWGKKWAMESLGLNKPYRSFDRDGWHFIALNSVEPFGNSYKARLGDEQLEWLKNDLASVAKGVPVLVMSHIPILSPCVALLGKETPEHNLNINGAEMHLDGAKIHELFRQQGNVKLCLSGHIHTIDRAEFDGVTYITSGAVSSGWWKKVHLGRFDYGYALVDLFKDGTFNYQYVPYGWKTLEEAAGPKKTAAVIRDGLLRVPIS